MNLDLTLSELLSDPTKSDLQDFFHDLTHSGYSNEKYSTVVHQGDRLVAICLCSVSCHDYSKDVTSSEVENMDDNYANEIAKGPYKQHKANKLIAYVSALERGLRRLPGHSTNYFKIDVIAVAIEAKGRGLGQELTQRSINIARSEGCDWVIAAATAAASQTLFSRMGFETYYELPYSNFRENGVVVFNNLYDGCLSGKLMALRLHD
ncbi:hypothetical protein KIN20_034318 [Parelaphostrongylus tenuis]|uniref:N-acetyltransferase domain-containing protein n=1 Tax=Parelaphostrongylus tenuis TaxID=148309 RepID=A0AAD5RCD1_PARTN|nr:hypothetical protein KIN20_034318 [Parelaphostrongylus tenuis]